MTEYNKRFVVLRFGSGWIVWDNEKARIIDGIYHHETEYAIVIAEQANARPADYDREWIKPPTDFEDSL